MPTSKTAAGVVRAGPVVDEAVDLAPAAQVEVADAEIGPLGDLEGLGEGREKAGFDVVEDAGHLRRRGEGTGQLTWSGFGIGFPSSTGSPRTGKRGLRQAQDGPYGSEVGGAAYTGRASEWVA